MTSEYTEVRASKSKIPLKENVKNIKIQQELRTDGENFVS